MQLVGYAWHMSSRCLEVHHSKDFLKWVLVGRGSFRHLYGRDLPFKSQYVAMRVMIAGDDLL